MIAHIIDNRVGEPDTDLMPPHIDHHDHKNFPYELRRIKAIKGYGMDRTGLPRCLEAIATDFNHRFGDNITSGNIILATGGRGAMTSAALRVRGKMLRAGHDFTPKVLLMQPGYNLFEKQYEGLSWKFTHVNIANAKNDDERLALIKQSLDKETLMLPICSPNNPDGKIYSEYFLKGILKLMLEFPRLHITYDAIYAPIVRGPNVKVPNIFTLCGNDELRSRIFVADALSKSYALACGASRVADKLAGSADQRDAGI